MSDHYRTVREAADILHLSVPTVYWYARRGSLPRYKVGSKLLFLESDLHQFMAACRIEATDRSLVGDQ